MRRLLTWAGVWLLTGAIAQESGAANERTPDLTNLMDGVIAQLPHDPLTITGNISVTRRRGVEVRSFGFEMRLELGAAVPTVRYTIRDALGRNGSRLTCRWKEGEVSYAYAEGDGLVSAATPDLAAAIQGSDVSWNDLTLSFLWWREGRVTGDDVVKGRACWVAELVPPGGGGKGSVRVWVDKQFPMLLQAESLDAKGRRSRMLWVRSLKKIKGRWMVREMEVQQEPKEHMTHILITGLDGEALATVEESGDRVSPVSVGTESPQP